MEKKEIYVRFQEVDLNKQNEITLTKNTVGKKRENNGK